MKKQDKIIKKIDDTIITTFPNNPRHVIVTTDKREAKASTIDSIIGDWVKNNYSKNDVSSINVKEFVNSIVYNNILWVSSNMNNEVDKLTEKILSKKQSNLYNIDWLCKQIAQHYRTIYKRKNV